MKAKRKKLEQIFRFVINGIKNHEIHSLNMYNDREKYRGRRPLPQ